MSSPFRALRSRNYRLWISGTVVSNTGTWMQRTAQDWLVLTELTRHSGVAVGITTGLQFAPLLLLSAHAGMWADRLPKRKVLMCTQSVMGLSALALGLLVVTHTVELWHVYVCALLLGLGTAFDNPSRQAFVSEVVAPPDVSSAVSLNSASFNVARLIGPGVAGVLIADYGTGPSFLINAASFVAVLIALARMRAGEMYISARTQAGPRQILDGLRYVRGRPDLMLILFTSGIVSTFGLNFQLTNALMASGPFHRGPKEYGLLGSVMAIGALSAAIIGARRERPRLTLVVAAAASFGTFVVVAALMPDYYLYALLLIPVGLSTVTFLNSCNTAVQLTAEPSLRGRVLALYVMVQQGTTPLGAPVVGWIGGEFGARWAVLVGGMAALIAASISAIVLVRRPDIRTRFAAAFADVSSRVPVPRPAPAGNPSLDSAPSHGLG
jgi:MFS family permease